MSADKRFVLDANVFIEAQKRYYSFDICPGFWSALSRQHEASRVCSLDKIKDELTDAELSAWAKDEAPATFFKKSRDKKVVDAYTNIMEWVDENPQYSRAAKSDFAGGADGWLIAFGYVNNRIVVTHESFDAYIKKKVKIPNVCRQFDVKSCDTFQMLQELGEQFGPKHRHKKK